MKYFNLNDDILVAITDYGWSYLNSKFRNHPNYITYSIKPHRKVINDKEYYELQMHQIIEIFGEALWITSHSPIEVNIILDENLLKPIS